jgi:Glycosyl transferase family 90
MARATGMGSDPELFRATTCAFVAGLSDFDEVTDRTLREIGRRVAELAARFGWSGPLAVTLGKVDLPRVAEFPPTAHERACVVRASRRGMEIVLNARRLDDASWFRILVSRVPLYVWLFAAALEREPVLDVEVPCSLGDVSFWPVPSYSSTHAAACLLPDPAFYESGGYAEFRRDMAVRDTPWEARRATVFWRGSTSGIKRYWPPRGAHDVEWLPRIELCARVQRSPRLRARCDVGLTNVVQIASPLTAEVVAADIAGLMRPPLPKAGYSRFKAVLDVDGNSNSWSGLFTSLLTGACVLKIESPHGFRQWYYDRLEPWVHYVPVRSDLSDLEDRVEHMLEDDGLARSIGDAGRRFATSLDYGAEMLASIDRFTAWLCRRRSLTDAPAGTPPARLA